MNKKLVYGFGVYEKGTEKKLSYLYCLWKDIIRGFYDEKSDLYKVYGAEGYRICDEFKYYQQFCKQIKKIPFVRAKDEKDRTYNINLRILSPNKLCSLETICFVPREINVFLNNKKIKYKDLPQGVSFCKRANKYRAYISVEDKNKFLGTFDNVDDAEMAYKKAREQKAIYLANKYKGKVEDRVYRYLINHKEE